MKYIGLFILLIAFVIEAYARVRTKANTGIDIYWGQNESINVEVVLNSLAINDNDVQTITAASINQWNTYSNTKIYPDYVNSKTTAAKNTIEFVQVPNPYIGAGVVAVTTVNFSNLTGRIKSAQIYLNEKSGLNPAGYDFTTVPGSNPQIGQDIYLGDVLTHELGHYLGLGHSEVQDSTMIYTAYKNQYDLADEDIEAIESIYPTSTNYELKGRVIGGKQVPVFGASVKLISSKDGSVYASRISDEYGEFNFDGLQSVDNNYYIYIEPVKRLDAIPAYYTTVQTNFCPDDYVGTFFTDCSSANKGFPQKISLSSTSQSVDVGDISIGCELGVNSDYLSTRTNGDNIINLNMLAKGNLYNSAKSFVGFFYSSQVDKVDKDSSVHDYIYLDLRNENVVTSKILSITTLAKSFGVPVDHYISVRRVGDGFTYASDLDGEAPILINLDPTSSNNYFEIQVKPQMILDTQVQFPKPEEFLDNRLFYHMMFDIRDIGGNIITATNEGIDDNYRCTDAPFTYEVEAVKEPLVSEQELDAFTPACGTIEPPDDPNSGMQIFVTLMLGFLLSFAHSFFGKSRKFM